MAAAIRRVYNQNEFRNPTNENIALQTNVLCLMSVFQLYVCTDARIESPCVNTQPQYIRAYT